MGWFSLIGTAGKFLQHFLAKIVPTWCNSHSGTGYIAKILDRTLIYEDLIESIGIYRAWVEYPYVSDHASILLQLDIPPLYKVNPFNFNPLWTKPNDFILMMQNLWKDPKYLIETSKKKCLVWKLKDLKVITKRWQKE